MKTLFVYDRLDGYIIAIQEHILQALEALNIEFRVTHTSGVKEAFEKFQPTTLLYFHPWHLPKEHIEWLDSVPCHKVLWSMEEPYEIDLTVSLLSHFYYVVSQDFSSVTWLKKHYDKGIFLPHSFNPKVHRPIETVPYEYRSDLFFCGNAYPERIRFFEEVADFLKDYLVTIVGVGYRGMAGYGNQRIVHQHISTEEMVKYINGAKINLNLHRLHGMDMNNSQGVEFSSPNNRFFELAGIGACQLVDASRKYEIPRYFEKDELAVFENPEEFKLTVNWLMNSTEIRKKIGEKARKRALKEHTYEHRLNKTLLKILQSSEPEKYGV